jgi:hypothetical protein
MDACALRPNTQHNVCTIEAFQGARGTITHSEGIAGSGFLGLLNDGTGRNCKSPEKSTIATNIIAPSRGVVRHLGAADAAQHDPVLMLAHSWCRVPVRSVRVELPDG